MGRNRRTAGAQGIRKKKSKQTLVKVAERRERKQEKIEASILARQGVRKNALVGIASTKHQVLHCDETSPLPLYHQKDVGAEERSIARKVKKRQSVYNNLLVCLKRDAVLWNEEPNREMQLKTSEEQSTAAHHHESQSQTKNQPQKVRTRCQDLVEETTEKRAADVRKLSAERISTENYAAAVRESQQFASGVVPQHIEPKAKVIGTFGGLGRVSASVPSGHFEVLSQRFLNGFEDVDDVSLGLRPSLYNKWKTMVAAEFPSMKDVKLARLHRACIAVIREYRDIFISGKHSKCDDDFLRRLYTAHCLSHILRCRNRSNRNDVKLRQATGEEREKDQGFCKARVLMLLPMKNVAYEVVRSLQALAVGADEAESDVSQIENKDRFEAEFAPDPSEVEESDKDFIEDKEDSLTSKKRRKPSDHRRTFRGNIDDDFKLGIAFTKKSMKLYNDFYSSDLIIASPLGLRRLLAEKASGKDIKAKLEKKKKEEAVEWRSKIGKDSGKSKIEVANSDFLSSIEICVIDGLHIFSMQNWETLLQTVSMTNQMPSSTRDTDFSRIRDWCLDGLMRNFRQTILLSEYRKAEFLSLFRELVNHSGKVQVIQAARVHGTMADVLVDARQTFFKLHDVESPLQAIDTRFDFFFDKAFPQLRSLLNSRSLIVIPTYFDYVRVRNRLVAMAKDDLTIRFTSMCEYSKPNEISRARSRLFDGSVSMVLITERFHYYWRHWIRGANTLVWYALPENAIFYPELLNMTAEATESGQAVHSIALYNTYDSFRLERIVGTSRMKKMVSRHSRSVYLFR
ncbi:unnamed protein product [Agarophyton chilense]